MSFISGHIQGSQQNFEQPFVLFSTVTLKNMAKGHVWLGPFWAQVISGVLGLCSPRNFFLSRGFPSVWGSNLLFFPSDFL